MPVRVHTIPSHPNKLSLHQMADHKVGVLSRKVNYTMNGSAVFNIPPYLRWVLHVVETLEYFTTGWYLASFIIIGIVIAISAMTGSLVWRTTQTRRSPASLRLNSLHHHLSTWLASWLRPTYRRYHPAHGKVFSAKIGKYAKRIGKSVKTGKKPKFLSQECSRSAEIWIFPHCKLF